MACSVVGIGRLILVILNITVLIISLGVMIAGILLKYFFNVFAGYLFDIADGSDMFKVPGASQDLDIPLAAEAGLVLLVFGAILFLVSFTACCGACGKWRPLLITFIILMILLIIGQAVMGGLFFTEDSVLHKTIKEQMTAEVREEFKADGSSLFDVSINAMHVLLECCGLSGWEDFEDGQKPGSCCNRTIIYSTDAAMVDVQQQCANATHNGPDNMYNEKGCYDQLMDKVLDNLMYAGIALSAVMLLEIFEVVFACLIVKDVNKSNVIDPV